MKFLLALSILALPVLAEDKPGSELPLNRLAKETSPYLRQHASNPVDWYPWGDEAFAKARKENKPIFLSVGYSTCHWCHVMARESFANKEIAAVMNEHFINIKLDREERPDVDQVYMTFVQASTGSGGWPLNVWLTPDLKPFVGGTYFPPESSGGQPGFKSVLLQLSEAWKKDEKAIREQAGNVVDELRKMTSAQASADKTLPDAALFKKTYDKLLASFDKEYGGFGKAPKFPRVSTYELLHHFAATKEPSKDKALEMSNTTLDAINRGGIHDHLGGGFHRYSVDRFWHVPHYEKMLYDQAQLTIAFLEADQLKPNPSFRVAARDICDYVERVLTHPDGGFFSAEDADSMASPDADHKTEGAFYIWTKAEVDQLLGDDAELFNAVYGVEESGNSPPGSDPHGELKGQNTLIRRLSDSEAATKFKLKEDDVKSRLASASQRLFDAREKRSHPHLDDKVLTAWNGLMISAYARAHKQLGDSSDLASATRAAEFIKKNLYDADRGVLLRSYRDGSSGVDGFAADYAFLIQGLIDLYEAGFDIRWLRWADLLQKKQDELFLDKEHGGYFATTGKDASVLIRPKESYDGAEPSENSVSAQNLQRFGSILHQPDRIEQAKKIVRTFGTELKESPTALPKMLVSSAALQSKPAQIVIAGEPGAADTKALIKLARTHAKPNQVIVIADGGDAQKFLASHAEFFESIKTIDGKATAYICENFVCQLPSNDPAVVEEMLKAGRE
ncbi:thioredoxin domain-containing protein [Haloferula sp.]|uniref:thioredoxin domain-containing protein n=1 Tax=Haloferula sp. TaxID=2497595 RepID=UPI00329F031A